MRAPRRRDDELAGIPGRFWRDLASATDRALLLDYDGTLAPFRALRETARPGPGIARALTRIADRRRTALAIVSGRPIAELRRLLPDLPVHMIGEHGWELQPYGSPLVRRPLLESTAERLSSAVKSASAAGLAKRIERKRASAVLHLRGVRASEASRIGSETLDLWRTFLHEDSLILRRTNGGIELRASKYTKGTAVRELLSGYPEALLPVYIGDDETDEDAFREIHGRGWTIWVGPERSSAALGWLPSCTAVRAFLEKWEQEVDGYAR